MTCHCASLADTTARFFDERRVRSELAAYRRVGPRVTTQGLLGELAATGPAPEALLDVGCGIGGRPVRPRPVGGRAGAGAPGPPSVWTRRGPRPPRERRKRDDRERRTGSSGWRETSSPSPGR